MRSVVIHTVSLLKFYARSRLILAFALVVLGLWSLGLIPLFMFDSSGGRFETLKYLSSQMHGLVWFATAALGLFAIWSHVNHRNTSLVFTRPNPPEAWIAAVFLSAFTVAVVAHVVMTALTMTLALAWHIPIQAGFVWISLDSIFESIIIVSALTALATAIHPIIAVIAFAVFSESVFYQLDLLLLSYMQSGHHGIALRGLEWLVRAVHAAVPMLDPFATDTAAVANSLRVTPADWAYLAATGAYAALCFLFFFLFADYCLRRRPAV